MVEAIIATLIVLTAAVVLARRVQQALRCSVREATGGCAGCGHRGGCSSVVLGDPEQQLPAGEQEKST